MRGEPDTLKTLSFNQLVRLTDAKDIREKEAVEGNKHSEQCSTIPTKDEFNGLNHGIYLEPCYKKFTSLLCLSRKRVLSEELNKSCT